MTAMIHAFRKAQIGQIVVCDYCSKPAELVTGDRIYPNRPDLHEKLFWRCVPCEAYVGCHMPKARLGFTGKEPLGRLADKSLRRAKNAAHAAFDPLWKDGLMRRKSAYAWLAGALGISVARCHIGEFDLATCQAVVELATAKRRAFQSFSPAREQLRCR